MYFTVSAWGHEVGGPPAVSGQIHVVVGANMGEIFKCCIKISTRGQQREAPTTDTSLLLLLSGKTKRALHDKNYLLCKTLNGAVCFSFMFLLEAVL